MEDPKDKKEEDFGVRSWSTGGWGPGGGGGGGDLYTNAAPMPITIGGWTSGSTFTNRTMQEMWDGLLYPYQAPAFTAYLISGQVSPLEVGDQIAINRTFTWTTSNNGNIQVNSISLIDVTGGSIVIASGLANDGIEVTAYPAVPIQKTSATTHTFRIDGINTQLVTFNRNYTVTWQWRGYYGESVNAGPLVEADVEGLRVGALTGGFAGTYVFLAGGYKYLCYPAVLGTATTFKDQLTNFDVPFEASYLVSVTNSFSQTTNYRVHRTTNVLGSAINIVVS